MAKGTVPARRPALRRALVGLATLGAAPFGVRGVATVLWGLPGVRRMPRGAVSARAPARDERAELQEVFAAMDDDGNEAIDAEEFASALDSAGHPLDQLSQEERDAMFRTADADTSSGIDFQEFESWALRARDCAAAFRRIDRDGDGYIDFEEWQRMAAALTKDVPAAQDDLDDVFDELDVDGDGLISFAEFARWQDQPGAAWRAAPRHGMGLRGIFSKLKGLLRVF